MAECRTVHIAVSLSSEAYLGGLVNSNCSPSIKNPTFRTLSTTRRSVRAFIAGHMNSSGEFQHTMLNI